MVSLIGGQASMAWMDKAIPSIQIKEYLCPQSKYYFDSRSNQSKMVYSCIKYRRTLIL